MPFSRAALVALAVCLSPLFESTFAHGLGGNGHSDDSLRERHARQVIHRRMHRVTRRQNEEKGQAALLSFAADSDSNSTTTTTPANTTSQDSVVEIVVYQSIGLWYEATGSESACHTVNKDRTQIIGLPTSLWPNPAIASDLCGKKVMARNTLTNKTIPLVVGDASGKAEYTTMSLSSFQALGTDLETGMFPLEFWFTDPRIVTPLSNRTSLAAVNSSSNSTLPATRYAYLPAGSDGGKTAVQTLTSTRLHAETNVPTKTSTVVRSSATTSADSDNDAAKSSSLAAAAAASASAKAEADAKAKADAAAKAQADAAAADAAAKKKAQDEAAARKQAQEDAARKAEADAAAAKKKADDEAAAAAAAAAKKKADDEAAAAKKKADEEAAAAKAAEDAKKKEEEQSSGGGKGGNNGALSFGTYYMQNGVAGHCGKVRGDGENLIALPSAMYDGGSHCGKKIRVCRADNPSRCVVAEVADSCPTCETNTSLDLSEGAFMQISTAEEGMPKINWTWL